MNAHSILTIVGQDEPGIISAVTGVLFKHKCNLEDVSMTVLEGEFAMILIMKGDISLKSIASLKRALDQMMNKFKRLRFDLAKLPKAPKRGKKHQQGTIPYIVTAHGRDRTGIVFNLCQFFAKKKYNITDLNSCILGKGAKGIYMLILEVDIPRGLKIPSIAKSLNRMALKLKIDISIREAEELNA